jgi:hypothetical protein
MARVLILVPFLLAAAPAQDVQTLAFMSGDWTTTSGKHQIEEHWTQPAAGTLVGMGRTIVGDRTVTIEFLRIETRADGIYYVAQPGGRPPTDFRCTRMSATEVVFENPTHDFPKRIIYRKAANGGLDARVEGDAGDKVKAEDFHYRRP